MFGPTATSCHSTYEAAKTHIFNAYTLVGSNPQPNVPPKETGTSAEAKPRPVASPASAFDSQADGTDAEGEDAEGKGASGERNRICIHDAFIADTQYFSA